MQHAVIMAGGSGTRLWPLSRRKRPKQLLRLFDGKSLLQLSRERLADLFEPENTWVITSGAYAEQVAIELPDIPTDNRILEPKGRDTANAIGLVAALLHRRDPGGTMAVFTADHLISPRDKFIEAIETGLAAAEQHTDALVTFGITPTEPATGYGYVKKGKPLASQTYEVLEFKEKPTGEIAERYVASGEYLWNSGMFVWRIAAIRKQLARHLPNNATQLDWLAANLNHGVHGVRPLHRFEALDPVSIDFGVMEKAERVLVVEMPCRWSDLGSWTAIADSRSPDSDGNVSIGKNVLVEDGRGNIVVSESDHLIVALGVDDLVIVHSDDATLICRRHHAQQVRDLAISRTRIFGDRFE